MQNHIIDLIVYLVQRIQVGEKIREIDLDSISGYDSSEVSAAYSWVLQKYNAGELDQALKEGDSSSPKKPHRVLHFAERAMISKEAYGFLMQLYHMRIITYQTMERIIEQAMLNSSERVSLHKVKELLTEIMFDQNLSNQDFSSTLYLKGNETIN